MGGGAPPGSTLPPLQYPPHHLCLAPPPSLFCSSTFLFHLRLLALPPKSPTSTTATIVPYSLLTAIPPSSAADPAPHQSQQCLLSIKYLVRQGLCALAAWISSHPETIDDVCVRAGGRAGVCALERFRRRDLDDKNLKCSFALFFGLSFCFLTELGVKRGQICLIIRRGRHQRKRCCSDLYG